MKPVGLIAIMGGTGTGKSTFINTIIGKDVTDVGHGLESQTTEVKEYEFSMPNGVHVTLVDTPGFNDYNDNGGKSDLVILKEIGAYLKAKYDEKRKFSGILYLHNIGDPKVGGSSQRNMAMFKKLCGPDPLKNVVVVTTFWDEVDLTQGVENETELKTKDKFFKGLVDGKCRFARSGKYSPGKTPKGSEFPPPISIVSDLLALNPVFVEMQKELAEGKTVEKTSAGVELYKELQELKRQQEKDVTDLNQKIAEMKSINARDREAREALEDESKVLKAQLEELVTKQHNLHQEVHSGRSELVSAITQLKRDKEASAKQRELDLDNIRRIELQHELELLKTLHAKEVLECQFQIRSLIDGSSHDAYQRSQLEKTCENLRATVSDLSQSLNKLRDTSEKDALARTELAQECAQLRAKVRTHDKTLSDLTEAKSKIALLESQLKISQEAQEKMASELSRSPSARENAKSNKDGARELRSPQSPSLYDMISRLSSPR